MQRPISIYIYIYIYIYIKLIYISLRARVGVILNAVSPMVMPCIEEGRLASKDRPPYLYATQRAEVLFSYCF